MNGVAASRPPSKHGWMTRRMCLLDQGKSLRIDRPTITGLITGLFFRFKPARRRRLWKFDIYFRYLRGAPGEIRTPDPQIRSLVLYPAELRARAGCVSETVFAKARHP
jgi:hypothetical protein